MVAITIGPIIDTTPEDDKSDDHSTVVYIILGCSSLLLITCFIFALFWVFRKRLWPKIQLPEQKQLNISPAKVDKKTKESTKITDSKTKNSASVDSKPKDSAKGTDSNPKAKRSTGVTYSAYYQLLLDEERKTEIPHYIDIDTVATAENLKKLYLSSSLKLPKTKLVYAQEGVKKSTESAKSKSFGHKLSKSSKILSKSSKISKSK